MENNLSTKMKLDVRGLSVFYKTFKALNNVSMDIQEHNVTALIGPSGCGKSTFLRSLNRLNDLVPGIASDGEVLLDGEVEAGEHRANWDAAAYSSGVYFYRLTTGDQTTTKRMTLLK